MTRRLAVAVIHGMGRQQKKDIEATGTVTYSRRLRDRLRRELGADWFDARVAWREIFWADIVQQRQDAFEKSMRRLGTVGFFRSYAMHRLADAANYFPSGRAGASGYERIHQRIDRTLTDLEKEVVAGSPLLVLAHSLGGHMMSNYIWDVTTGHRPRPSGFGRFETLAGLLTFGCNIPIFTFSCDEVVPIAFPGQAEDRADPWWRNFYDNHDPLGYPLGVLPGGYAKMAETGELSDVCINVGWRILQSWNPWCHNGYWHDRGFARQAAGFVREIAAARDLR